MGWYRSPDGQSAYHLCGGRGRRGNGLPSACVAPALEGDNLELGPKCARPSVALCDYPAGKDLRGTPLTCDAPMCEQHRTSVGPDRDHCPRHQKVKA